LVHGFQEIRKNGIEVRINVMLVNKRKGEITRKEKGKIYKNEGERTEEKFNLQQEA
jgi:hypothetical protein